MPAQSEKYIEAKKLVEKLRHLKSRESYALLMVKTEAQDFESITKLRKGIPVQISELTEFQRKIYERQRKYVQRARDARAEYESIVQAIEDIPDPMCRSVLEHHYICRQTWDDIACENNYSLRQVFRIRDKALMMLKLPDQQKNMS